MLCWPVSDNCHSPAPESAGNPMPARPRFADGTAFTDTLELQVPTRDFLPWLIGPKHENFDRHMIAILPHGER